MKLGMLARCDNRGLGTLTWEAHRHLNPERTLVIHDPRSIEQGFAEHPERFPDAHHTTIVPRPDYDAYLDEDEARSFLQGLDVVYTAESFYDWRFCDWARDMGVRTVVHVMPEFWHHARLPSLPRPDAWWNPTSWRQRHLPRGTRIVPLPIATDRWPDKPDFEHNPKRILHIVGSGTPEDRNGTQIAEAVAALLPEFTFEFTAQTAEHPNIEQRDYDNYWDLYATEAPLVLMPRRFGGLCLPALEAFGAGKTVMMPSVAPNTLWPVLRIPTHRSGPRPRTVSYPGGQLELADTDPATIAERIRIHWSSLPDSRLLSWAWAQKNSWEALLPKWTTELERVASL